ncbi:MAG: hypothetical protein AAB225_30615 [Acidobacteriota bacterium]
MKGPSAQGMQNYACHCLGLKSYLERPGDGEYSAGKRLLRRTVSHLGPRFADYVVADGEFATAPFLHVADKLELPIVARLKDNLPELRAAVEAREVFEADWLTNFPKRKLNSLGLYRIGKSRWEIENQGFNGGAGDAVLSNSSATSPPPPAPPDFRNCWGSSGAVVQRRSVVLTFGERVVSRSY